MTTLTAQTTFTVLSAAESYEEVVDLVLLPENSGVDAARELRYPGDVYPAIIYETNPDKWENFDSAPLTDKPQVKADMTLASVQVIQWRGYIADKPIREYWLGSENRSRVTSAFIRRLYEYLSNPPSSGYITWAPKDRSEAVYNVKLESLTVGGQEIAFMDAAIRHDLMPWEVCLSFRIISEVT